MRRNGYVFTRLMCFIVVWILVSMLVAGISHSGEYRHVYTFVKPVLTELDDGTHLVEIPDTWQNDTIPEAPVLPAFTANLFVPADEAVVTMAVVTGKPTAIDGVYDIQISAPASPLSSKTSRVRITKKPPVVPAQEQFPPQPFAKRGSQYLCGVQVVQVELSPVVYNSAAGKVRYYPTIEVKLITKPHTPPASVMPFRNAAADRARIAAAVDNEEDFIAALPATQVRSKAPGRYIIITTEDLVSAFEDLKSFRETPAGGGFTVSVETIENIEATWSGRDAAEKVRNFIRNCYACYNTQFVVLGGDCDGSPDQQAIPTRGAYGYYYNWVDNISYEDHYVPSDLYFGCLDGTWNEDGDSLWGESRDGVAGGDIDWYPEVYVGRIAADDAVEAQNHIDKIIAFETSPSRPYETLLVGEMMYYFTFGGDRLDWVYTFMNGMPRTTLYDRDRPPLYYWFKPELINLINSDAYNWINHCGHSDYSVNMRLSNNDVSYLTNSNYFFIYTQGCYCGSLDSRMSPDPKNYAAYDCFGEVVTCGYGDRGAFAYLGNSRYGWYDNYYRIRTASNLAHAYFVRAVFEKNMTQLGVANQWSKAYLPLSYGLYRWIAFELNLLGDPATPLNIPALP